MNVIKRMRYRETTLSARSRERLQRTKRRFDLVTVALALLVVIAMLVSSPYAYELGSNRPEGFATWFLLFLAYLPLEIVGLVTWIFGLQDSTLIRLLVEEQQTLALGVFNLAMLAVVWLTIRFYFCRRFGINFLRSSCTVLTILAVWGGFQLGCMAAVVIWERGGFSPLHQHLRRASEPERVIVVGKDLAEVEDPKPMPKTP